LPVSEGPMWVAERLGIIVGTAPSVPKGAAR
jgi:hypothetical protein